MNIIYQTQKDHFFDLLLRSLAFDPSQSLGLADVPHAEYQTASGVPHQLKILFVHHTSVEVGLFGLLALYLLEDWQFN